MINFKEDKGQTMLEILVAIAVLVMVLVAIVSRVVEAVRNAHFARNQVLATRFSQEGVEWARSQRDRLGWSSFSTYIPDGVIYCVPDPDNDIEALISGLCTSADKISGTVFYRELAFQSNLNPAPGDGEAYTQVTSEVTWLDSIGEHNSQLTTRLSKWSRQQ